MAEPGEIVAVRTVFEVHAALDALKAVAGDNESAHVAEDELWCGVLKAIADGEAENPQRMAQLALTSWDLDFARWYA